MWRITCGSQRHAASTAREHPTPDRRHIGRWQLCRAAPQERPTNSLPEAEAYKRQHDPVSLAFLGDSIWSLYVRARCLPPPKRFESYHQQALRHVNAEQQAAYHDQLLQGDVLTAAERELLSWALATSKVKMRKRFDSQAKVEVYRKATALEALLGYLQLTSGSRLQQLLDALGVMMDEADASAD